MHDRLANGRFKELKKIQLGSLDEIGGTLQSFPQVPTQQVIIGAFFIGYLVGGSIQPCALPCGTASPGGTGFGTIQPLDGRRVVVQARSRILRSATRSGDEGRVAILPLVFLKEPRV